MARRFVAFVLFLVDGRVVRCGRADSLPLLVSRAAASLDAGRGLVRRPAVRPARAADEPRVSGPLLAARFRQERLRRARVRRRRPRAADDEAGSVRLDGAEPRRRASRCKYKVFGDRVDGTYLGIDATHAHINMPAAVMWARGFDDRPATIAFDPPAGKRWQVATQLHPADLGARVHRAEPSVPDGQPGGVRTGARCGSSRSGRSTFPPRAAPHRYRGRADSLVKDVEQIVRQEGAIYGEYPDVRAGLLHVPRGSAAVRERRRHGAPQQHGDHRRR